MKRSETIEKRKPRRFSPEERCAYIEKWQASNLSKSQFCNAEGLVFSTFCSWVQNKSRPAFIPITVSPAKRDCLTSNLLKITLPNGLSVEGIFRLTDISTWLKEIYESAQTL